MGQARIYNLQIIPLGARENCRERFYDRLSDDSTNSTAPISRARPLTPRAGVPPKFLNKLKAMQLKQAHTQ